MDVSNLTETLGSSLKIQTQGTILSFAKQNNKWNNAEDASDVVKAINECKNLKGLCLEANSLGVEAAKVIGDALADHPEFEEALWKDLFTGRLKTEIPQALKHLFGGLIKAGAKLKELDLSDNALGPIGVEGMVDFMKSPVCYSLEILRLNNNGLGIKGGTMLAKSLLALAKNAKFSGTTLKLKVFICGRNRLEKEGASIFGTFFAQLNSLEEVAMPQNGINRYGIRALAAGLSCNTNLKIINLNDNTFTPMGAMFMKKYIPHMKNLEVINFGDCLVKTKGATILADAIKPLTQLKELHLDGNEIRVSGAEALIDAIEGKQDFKLLLLDCNQFGEDGCLTITKKLEAIGKIDCLGSLDDDEEPDSDDESGSDEEESEIEEGEVAEESLKEEDPMKIAKDFLEIGTWSLLLQMGEMTSSLLLKEAERRALGKSKNDPSEYVTYYCTELMTATMKLLQHTQHPKPEVAQCATSGAKSVASVLFDQSIAENDLTNILMVHLGCVKSEDKKFRIEWDLKACLLGMRLLVTEPYFNKNCLQSLQVILNSDFSKLSSYKTEKDQLLQVMPKA